MVKTTIFALSGWKGSGKDTVAGLLSGFTRVAFADKLKDTVATMFKVPRADLDDPAKKEAPILTMPVVATQAIPRIVIDKLIREFRLDEQQIPTCGPGWHDYYDTDGYLLQGNCRYYWTPRALCILIGTMMRTVIPSYWIDQTLDSIQVGGQYVITDVRFPEEIRLLKDHARKLNAIVVFIRVNRAEAIERSRLTTDESEHALDNYSFDYCITNDSTIAELQEKVNMVKRLTIVPA
jgi:hypothetical protein